MRITDFGWLLAGQAYPVPSIGYIVAALLAWLVLGEQIGLERWTGITLIITGVVFVSSSEP